MDNVLLTVRSGAVVTGRVQLDGGVQPSDIPALGRLKVEVGAGDTERGRVRADGTFMIADVFAGEYWVTIADQPPNTYLKEVRSRGTDLIRAPLTVTDSNPINVDLLISQGTARLEGTVLDQRQQTVSAECGTFMK